MRRIVFAVSVLLLYLTAFVAHFMARGAPTGYTIARDEDGWRWTDPLGCSEVHGHRTLAMTVQSAWTWQVNYFDPYAPRTKIEEIKK